MVAWSAAGLGAQGSGGLGVAFWGGAVAWLGSGVGDLAWAGVAREPGASGGWTIFMCIKISTSFSHHFY